MGTAFERWSCTIHAGQLSLGTERATTYSMRVARIVLIYSFTQKEGKVKEIIHNKYYIWYYNWYYIKKCLVSVNYHLFYI